MKAESSPLTVDLSCYRSDFYYALCIIADVDLGDLCVHVYGTGAV